MTLSMVVRKIRACNETYLCLARDIGITYSQLYRVATGRTINPKMDVWNKLLKWAETQ